MSPTMRPGAPGHCSIGYSRDMSTALITGATGFIGSHLVRRLLHDGLDVHVLCRPTSNVRLLDDVLPRVRAHTVDLTDGTGLASLVRAVRPKQIFHLAAATIVAGAAPGLKDLLDVNVLGTVNLIDACDAID